MPFVCPGWHGDRDQSTRKLQDMSTAKSGAYLLWVAVGLDFAMAFASGAGILFSFPGKLRIATQPSV